MFSGLVVATWMMAAPELPPPPHRASFAPFASDRVEDCLRDIRRQPRALLPYARLNLLALRPGSRVDALSALERLATVRATASRSLLNLAIARLKLAQRRQAEITLRIALKLLAAEGEEVGEVYGRLYLELILRLSGRLPEATEELRRAQQLAAGIGDPILSAEVQVFEAWEAFSAKDHGRALTLFESARDVLTQGPNGYLESLAWEGIAATEIELDRYRQALESELGRIRALERDGGPTEWARAAMANRGFYLASEGLLSWERADQLLDEAVEEATRTDSPAALLAVRYLQAVRLGATPDGEHALEALRSARVASGDPYEAIAVTLHLAQVRDALHPDQAAETEKLLTEAFEAAAKADMWDMMSSTLTARALLRWQRGDEPGARADTEGALRLHELARDQQFEDSARVGRASAAFMAYVDLANPLLANGRFREAFELIERMRARSLLDALRLDAHHAPLSPAMRERRKQSRARLSTLQSELVRAGLPAAVREERTRELTRAELEERQLDDEIARTSAPGRTVASPLRLEEIQARLAPDEALLEFVVAPEGHTDRGDFMVGPRSFLLVVTPRDVRPVRIPDREALSSELAMFLAGVEGRGGVEAPGATALYRQLVAEAVEGLDPGVRRLILLPSGPLHGLPFEILRSSPASPPLGAQYSIVRAPSATVWAYLRDRTPATGREPLMALADPSAPAGDAVAVRRAAPWIDGLHLGALPFARAEAEQAVRSLGPGSRLLVGPEASEHALKTLPLKQWAVLHVAAHAVVDDEFPERSAVVLTPGSPEEDGLLQSRDIADLDLDGMLVVLAACRSASGRPSNSDGPVGLGRAFLQAGARAVVVSLWELEDAASRRLFAHFYERLAEGDSVQEALRSARVARIRAGDAPADWAGLVVVGDGDLRLPHVVRHGPWVPVVIAGAAAVLALLLVATWRRRAVVPA
jgi:CHAT domain-containing protein/tetratricopeptide (TPR) repeat protein